MNGDTLLQSSQTGGWLKFHRPLEIITTTDPLQVRPLLDQIEQSVNQHGLFAAGFLTYEAASAFDPAYRVHSPSSLPLLWFGLYSPPSPVGPPLKQGTFKLEHWQPAIEQAAYETALLKIKNYIRRGETYQVNYTMRLRTPFAGDPQGLFSRLVDGQRSEYAAYIDTGASVICSASPELFFRRDGAAVTAKPMKGTAARGRTWLEDERQIDWLRNSLKNRAENVMIVDMVRNDLGRVATAGSIQVPQLFEVERYPTILQMTSTITARSSASTAEIMAALFPCASITGAPKMRAMEIIHQLEPEPRGIYTGCIGYIGPNQQAQFNVAIRTVVIDQTSGVAEYGVGGGIVWDSETAQEYQECRLKAKVLTEPRRPDFDLLETMLWEPDSGYFLLAEHLHRLTTSARYFTIPVDANHLRHALETVAASLDRPHRVRLLIAPNGDITTQAIPLDSPPVQKRWRVALARQPVNANDIFLFHKTTHRQVYTTAREAQPDCDEVILWNEQGQVTEATIANIVVQFGHELVTPPIECGLLAGTYRAHLLAQQAIRERIITVEELKHSDRIYLINSVRTWIEAELVA
ncbi:MAG: aminodeoxychorismate synthase component I [Anaerolineae bacterium]|nr:aminodeoxychorismate synthase component I [Anaerolineae bacterium]